MNLVRLVTILATLVAAQNSVVCARRHHHKRAVAKKYPTRPHPLVSFMFDPNIPRHSAERRCVHQAIKHIQAQSCVRLAHKTSGLANSAAKHNAGYVYFQNSSDPNVCSSFTGIKSFGPTVVNLGSRCATEHVCVRETLHALGLEYEHNRPDRNSYVNVHNQRLRAGDEHGYNKLITTHDYDFITPYDLSSIMHFRSTDNAAVHGDKTMQAKYHMMRESLGYNLRPQPRHAMSHRDALAVNELFGCSDACPHKLSCEHGGYMDRDCVCICPQHFTGKTCEKLANRAFYTDDACGVIKVVDTAWHSLTSPNFPKQYPRSSYCQWLLEADKPWEQLEFEIERVDLQWEDASGHDTCTDKLKIWPHGTDVTTGPLSCQPDDVLLYKSVVYKTQHNWLLVELRTSPVPAFNHSGFHIKYRVIDNKPVQDATGESLAQTSQKIKFGHLKTEQIECYKCDGEADCGRPSHNQTQTLCPIAHACASAHKSDADRSVTWRGCMNIEKCAALAPECSASSCSRCCIHAHCNGSGRLLSMPLLLLVALAYGMLRL